MGLRPCAVNAAWDCECFVAERLSDMKLCRSRAHFLHLSVSTIIHPNFCFVPSNHFEAVLNCFHCIINQPSIFSSYKSRAHQFMTCSRRILYVILLVVYMLDCSVRERSLRMAIFKCSAYYIIFIKSTCIAPT